MTYAKLVNNELKYCTDNISDDSKVSLGYKKLIIGDVPTTTVYELIQTEYIEDENSITTNNVVVKKSVEDIVAFNTNWWHAHYFLIPPLNLYASFKSFDTNGKEFDLLQDDISSMIMGAQVGMLTTIQLVGQPDFTQEFTQEYVDSLIVNVTDPNAIAAFIGYVASTTLTTRRIPKVI